MKNKLLIGLVTGLFLCGMAGMASATLITIGTATYTADPSSSLNTPLAGSDHDYQLIYDTDLQLTWLDYTHRGNWYTLDLWVASIGGALNVAINPSYASAIDWTTGWRLPEAGSNPDFGYNQTGSEMGHLYYTELGKPVGGPLGNTGIFSNLMENWYWSGTDYETVGVDSAWAFDFGFGAQSIINNNLPTDNKLGTGSGLAVRSGYVDTAPVPEPATMLLLGTGLIGLAGFRKRLKRN